MTTIIIIVVVALVFFVTICVVTFMVWKREAEMRTDSIKAIENSLGEMLDGLAGDQAASVRNQPEKKEAPYENVLQEMQNMQQEIGDKIKKESDSKAIRQKDRDPFSWVKMEKAGRKRQAADGGAAAMDAGADTVMAVTDAVPVNAGAVAASGMSAGEPAVAYAGAKVNAGMDTANTIAAYTGTSAYVDAGAQAGHCDDLTVFKPMETRPRGLKWVEVFTEKPGNVFKKRRRSHAGDLPEKEESPSRKTEGLPENAGALDGEALQGEMKPLPEKAEQEEARPEASPPPAEEIRLGDAEALLKEAEAFLEKKPQAKQNAGGLHGRDSDGLWQEAEAGSQEFAGFDTAEGEEQPYDSEESADLWDLEEDEPALWDFDEIAGHLSEESWQEAQADTYERIGTEASSVPAVAKIEAEQEEETAAEPRSENPPLGKSVGKLTAGASEKEEEAAGNNPDTPDATEPGSEIDEFLNELMNMPVEPAEAFHDETGASPTDSGFAGTSGEGLDGIYQFGHPPKPPTGYNIGRSGKEYTVSELEMLIKE